MTSAMPQNNAGYAHSDYWNARFAHEEQYDWLKGYKDCRHLCVPHLKTSDRILILGCGNSTLTQDLYNDGFHNLTSIDLSEVVIERMQAKGAAAGQSEICWQVTKGNTAPCTMSTRTTNDSIPWENSSSIHLHVRCTISNIQKPELHQD